MITSLVTISEFSVKPYKENDLELLNDFQIVLETFHVAVLDINRVIATNAGKLRAKYQSLKTVTALQLASAIYFGCKRFLTNDIRLKQVSEIEVVLIKDL